MAKSKAAGKENKPAAQAAPETQPGAHLDAPSAVAHPAAEQASGVTKAEAAEASKVKPGTVALVGKGTDRIPVQLKDEQHLAKLREEHGEGNVEVQS